MEVKYYQVQYQYEQTHWWYLGRRSVIARVLQRFANRPAQDVLEIGCGSGGNLPLLSTHAASVTAVEMEPIAVEEAQSRGIAQIVQGKLGDKLAVFERQYDLIAMFDVLEHIEDDDKALQQIRTLLKPGGRLVVAVPTYEYLWTEHDEIAHHYRRYSRARLLRLFRGHGYRVHYCSYFNTLLFPFACAAMLVARLLSRSPEAAMRQPSGWVNRLLTKIFSMEAALVPHIALPFGLSLILVAEVRQADLD